MKCPYCGSELEDDAQFCTACGRSLSDNAKMPDSADPNLIPTIGTPRPFETIKDADAGKGNLSEQVNQIRSRTRRRMPLLLLVVLVALGVAATAFAATLLWRYVIAPALDQRQSEGIEAVGGAGNGGNSAGGAASTSGAATTPAATSPATPTLTPVSPVTPATPENVALAGDAVAGDNGGAGRNGAAAGNAAGNGGATGNGGNRNNGNGGTTQANGTTGNGTPAVSPTSPTSPTSPQQPSTPSNPDNTLQAAYDTLLSQYRMAQENGWKTAAGDSADLQSLGSYLTSSTSNVPADSVVSYAFTDLGNDGVKDLVIGGVTPSGTYDVYGVYTGNGSTPASVMKGDLGAKSWWQVLTDSTLAHFGEGGKGVGATERLDIKDGKLTTTDTFGSDVDSSGNKYFYQGSKDNHITEDAYNALKDALPGKAQLDWKPLSDVTVPSTPSTPSTPATPETPSAPATPSTPETPSTPMSTSDTILSRFKAAQDRGWTYDTSDDSLISLPDNQTSYLSTVEKGSHLQPKKSLEYAFATLSKDVNSLIFRNPDNGAIAGIYLYVDSDSPVQFLNLPSESQVNSNSYSWKVLDDGSILVNWGSSTDEQGVQHKQTLWNYEPYNRFGLIDSYEQVQNTGDDASTKHWVYSKNGQELTEDEFNTTVNSWKPMQLEWKSLADFTPSNS